MNIQPPLISPSQMNLLRVVLSMAWADDSLEQKEVEVMIDHFSQLFATDPNQRQQLKQQLQEYFVQEIPLEETVSKLTTTAEKEVALRLSYEVISASTRTPGESLINDKEHQAYQTLVSLLNLPADVVERTEKAATAALNQSHTNVIDMLAFKLREHFIS